MIQSIITLLFPRACAACGEALRDSARSNEWHYMCAACARNLRRVDEKSCYRCGVPVYGSMSSNPICSVCRETPPVWDESRSLVRYTGIARAWVRDYKYNDARWVEREFVKLLGSPDFAWLKDWLKGAIVVPVPLHPLRRLIRGFNQSEEFSKIILKTLFTEERGQGPKAPAHTSPSHKEGAGGWAIPELNTQILKRIRWTRQQAKLRKKDRQKNVLGAFDVNPKLKPAELSTLLSRRIVIVDDLLTTGFTLTVCVNALKKAGFERVDVLTLARG